MYLGEEVVNIKDTEYKDYKKEDWAIKYIQDYSYIDGAHHKQWLLDQVVRILCGTTVVIKLAKWDDVPSEYRFSLDKPTQEYLDYVTKAKAGEDGPNTYEYDEGVTP